MALTYAVILVYVGEGVALTYANTRHEVPERPGCENATSAHAAIPHNCENPRRSRGYRVGADLEDYARRRAQGSTLGSTNTVCLSVCPSMPASVRRDQTKTNSGDRGGEGRTATGGYNDTDDSTF